MALFGQNDVLVGHPKGDERHNYATAQAHDRPSTAAPEE
jgi:hypothetical protein